MNATMTMLWRWLRTPHQRGLVGALPQLEWSTSVDGERCRSLVSAGQCGWLDRLLLPLTVSTRCHQHCQTGTVPHTADRAAAVWSSCEMAPTRTRTGLDWRSCSCMTNSWRRSWTKWQPIRCLVRRTLHIAEPWTPPLHTAIDHFVHSLLELTNLYVSGCVTVKLSAED